MKYRIDAPAYPGAPQMWDVVRIKGDVVVCRIYSTEKLAKKVHDLLEGETE